MAATKVVKATSNTDFARRVGIHYTMASRIRNGKRMPSAGTLSSVIEAFQIKGKKLDDLMHAVNEGQESFGVWVRANLFEPNAQSH